MPVPENCAPFQHATESETSRIDFRRWWVLGIFRICLGSLTAIDSSADRLTDPPMDRSTMWLSHEKIQGLPMEGSAWEQIKKHAYSEWGEPDLSNQHHPNNTLVLAGALVALRSGDDELKEKVRQHILAIPETENGGRTLALGRNLCAYVIAAGLIGLDDPEFDAWLWDVRYEDLSGKTLISTHDDRPNNWGTHAGASRIAAAIFLEDIDDLRKSADVFAGWLGDRSRYAQFTYGDLSWQSDPEKPVGINPVDATKEGHDIDGVIPDDQRRGGSFAWPPPETGYPWEALDGVVVQAELLHRQGHDAWNWSDRAVYRSVAFLYRIGWGVAGEDEEWLVHLVNTRYGSTFQVPMPARPGKSFGYTDWTHGVTSPGAGQAEK
ncbi:MAG: hypothetical protein DRP71_14490 [Verrucomicrobia bacterium]|nr:MAG: hypothetical protein DRP71_14490 [Verrucomicrobiota bacterium]